jgi:lipoprotein-anchoring transpeptidase ErfK/SrfK
MTLDLTRHTARLMVFFCVSVVVFAVRAGAQPAALAPPTAESPVEAKVVALQPGIEKTLRLQILLGRHHFSAGEIDGQAGGNTRRALAAYAKQGTGTAAETAQAALTADAAPTFATYVITAEGVAGPFEPIPKDRAEKGKLEALGFTSALEGLAEKFHAAPALLTMLNPAGAFDHAGEQITVPNVRTEPPVVAAKVVVDRSDVAVYALDAEDRVLARYPATMGSNHDPLPLGAWAIKGVSRNPPFAYDPELFWDSKSKDVKTRIAPGPNNTVGVVWIDLSKPHYGIHGSPEPSTIGKTQSHGCNRLTNWDASELAAMVRPGTPAILQE